MAAAARSGSPGRSRRTSARIAARTRDVGARAWGHVAEATIACHPPSHAHELPATASHASALAARRPGAGHPLRHRLHRRARQRARHGRAVRPLGERGWRPSSTRRRIGPRSPRSSSRRRRARPPPRGRRRRRPVPHPTPPTPSPTPLVRAPVDVTLVEDHAAVFASQNTNEDCAAGRHPDGARHPRPRQHVAGLPGGAQEPHRRMGVLRATATTAAGGPARSGWRWPPTARPDTRSAPTTRTSTPCAAPRPPSPRRTARSSSSRGGAPTPGS